MRKDVLVIGGGATGAGVARDLSMRGVDCMLLEMGDYCHGASGGNHGLLHSGGRYAVKDPSSASECAAENDVLRRIAAFCIEDTGGLFASFEGDDPGLGDRFATACRSSGVPADDLELKEARSLEPGLGPGLERCFHVRDGSIDPFSLVQANVDSARESGALIRNHSKVTALVKEGKRVHRVEYLDERDGEHHFVTAEVVVNAAGAWAAGLAGMAGAEVKMSLDQGSMLVMDGRACGHVVNRLRPPSNGDIAVPSHTTTVLGTTSGALDDPNGAGVMKGDVDLLVREAAIMLPSLAKARAVRAYCGVRPLLGGTGGRGASRSFAILRHEGVENMLTVVGGKLTTYRLMAEKVADEVCAIIGARGGCRTHIEELSPGERPPAGSIGAARLFRKYGGRSSLIPHDPEVICSCEQVMRSEVRYVLSGPDVLTMADVMRRTRAGMGYCQGLDCSLHVLEMMVEERDIKALPALQDFVRERARGAANMQGEQARQNLLRRHVLQGVHGLEVDRS